MTKIKNYVYLQFPGQYFIDVSVGVLHTNSCVLGSYVAVVSSPRMNVPGIEVNFTLLHIVNFNPVIVVMVANRN